MNEHAYFVNTPWTWRERLRFKLFPSSPCPLPEAPAAWQGCIVVTTIVSLSLVDRLRVLGSGMLKVETRTVTENIAGGTATESIAYPVWSAQ
jgi:hypothetical protein